MRLCLVIVFIGLSVLSGLAAQEEMKIRAFALKPDALVVAAPAGSSQGIDVLEELQKQYAIDLSQVPGVQAVYLPKEQSLVLRAPEKTIEMVSARMGRMMDHTKPAASGTSAVMQARLDTIILSEINFTEATSEDVASYVRQVAEPYGIAVQLLAQSDPETTPTVTLKLTNIPLSALLKYYTSLTNLPHRVQASSVVMEY
ncbi:MAG: hypothetical protein AAF649_11580 [Verrucomicrobiota bacterium]